MSERNNENSAKRPDLIAFSVTESKDGAGFWNKVGAGWAHKDGDGYEVDLNAIPVNGRITLRKLRDDQMKDHEDQRQKKSSAQSRERKGSRSSSRGRSR